MIYELDTSKEKQRVPLNARQRSRQTVKYAKIGILLGLRNSYVITGKFTL